MPSPKFRLAIPALKIRGGLGCVNSSAKVVSPRRAATATLASNYEDWLRLRLLVGASSRLGAEIHDRPSTDLPVRFFQTASNLHTRRRNARGIASDLPKKKRPRVPEGTEPHCKPWR